MSRSSTAAGFAAMSRWRLVLLLTFVSVALGVLSASPLGPSAKASLVETLAGDHLIRNHPDFAPVDFLDILKARAAAVDGWQRATLWAALLGVLLQIFFAGGIVETVGRQARPAAAEFWAASRRNFAHNLKCFALFGVALGVLLAVWISIGAAVVEMGFEKTPPNAPGGTAARFAVAAVALLLFAVFTLLYDFARAERRCDPEIGAFRAFRQARRRLGGRWLRGLGLLGLWTVLATAAIAGLFALAWAQRTPSGGAVAVNLLLLLLFLAVRPIARVGAWGSVLGLFDASALPPARSRRAPAGPLPPMPHEPVGSAPGPTTEEISEPVPLAPSEPGPEAALAEPDPADIGDATIAVRSSDPVARPRDPAPIAGPDAEPLADPFPSPDRR